MRLGFVGLGKMGSQIVTKLLHGGHEVVVTDINPDLVNQLKNQGAMAAFNREEMVSQLGSPAIVWFMIPAKFVSDEMTAWADILPSGAVLIDGGNTNFRQTIARAAQIDKLGKHLVDVGTSGGVMGQENGFSMMIGGDQSVFENLKPLFDTLSQPSGAYQYFGPGGSGHFVKMVHNGIEYGMMQALAEGYQLLAQGPDWRIDLAAVAEVWQHGSIVESKLNKLIKDIVAKNPHLEGIDGVVAETGEGQWTSELAHTKGIAMPVLEAALKVRSQSRSGEINATTKLLAALRNAFGGHNLNQP